MPDDSKSKNTVLQMLAITEDLTGRGVHEGRTERRGCLAYCNFTAEFTG